MRKVLIKKWIEGVVEFTNSSLNGWNYKKGTNCFEEDYLTDGLFHTWGVKYEELENGVGNFTVALVELNDGTIVEVLSRNIKFI